MRLHPDGRQDRHLLVIGYATGYAFVIHPHLLLVLSSVHARSSNARHRRIKHVE